VRALHRADHGPALGARVRLHGPLGLWRTARTRLLELDAPARVAGTAEAAGSTRAHVAWSSSRATAAAARSSEWAPRRNASGRSIGSCGSSSVAG
jgi:hypothetical protein